MDVHQFDGKLDPTRLEILRAIAFPMLREEQSYSTIRIQLSQPAQNMLDLLWLDSSGNNDQINGIEVSGLLYLALDMATKNPNFLQGLNIQLTDLNTGICPPGRSIRLFQLLNAYLDWYLTL